MNPKISEITAQAYTVPTDSPEADGTISWDRTTMILVTLRAANRVGIGYTYADPSAVGIISGVLQKEVLDSNPMDIPATWQRMSSACRNIGQSGLVNMAISAVDVALWDLKAKLLDLSLVDLLGHARDAVPIYGSGGFTSYNNDHLQKQLAGWVEQGIAMVKMKVGTAPEKDLDRVRAARSAIGSQTLLFVDANGVYSRKQALKFADQFTELGVVWFEEPVATEDLTGMRMMRDRTPAGMEIAGGEYGYDADYFRRMLKAQAIDVLQADATRCGGFTGFLRADALCQANHIPLSAHCAPTLHMAVGCAAPAVCHLEYFHDHIRIERMFFDGVPGPENGALKPNSNLPGMGIQFKRKDAEKYAVQP